ncbi:MAG TPA: hypothetical protein VIH28_08385 [Ignavibacteriaceae bacterium]
MNITSDQIVGLQRELIGLMTETLPLVQKYWLQKLFREVSAEYNDLLNIYGNWEDQNKGKSFQEFLTLNSEFKILLLIIKDITFKKSDFINIQMTKYPTFNLLFTKI